jgi:hypothetical protein
LRFWAFLAKGSSKTQKQSQAKNPDPMSKPKTTDRPSLCFFFPETLSLSLSLSCPSDCALLHFSETAFLYMSETAFLLLLETAFLLLSETAMHFNLVRQQNPTHPRPSKSDSTAAAGGPKRLLSFKTAFPSSLSSMVSTNLLLQPQLGHRHWRS